MPFILSTQWSGQALKDSTAPDFRLSMAAEPGLAGIKAKLGTYLVLTDSYCIDTFAKGGPRGYWGANKTPYWRNFAFSLDGALVHLWGYHEYRSSILGGPEFGVLFLRNYLTLMAPVKISAGVLFPVAGETDGVDPFYTLGLGLGW